MTVMSYKDYSDILRENCEHCGHVRSPFAVALDCALHGYVICYVDKEGSEVSHVSHPGPLGQAVLTAASGFVNHTDCDEGRVYEVERGDIGSYLGKLRKTIRHPTVA